MCIRGVLSDQRLVLEDLSVQYVLAGLHLGFRRALTRGAMRAILDEGYTGLRLRHHLAQML
jgi:hypothetical protein